MLTTQGQNELILLCDTVITELTCSRIGFCTPSNKQLASGKKMLKPIDVYVHIINDYGITRFDNKPICISYIIGYFNSKFKGYYGKTR
jgi:hypothetical protein